MNSINSNLKKHTLMSLVHQRDKKSFQFHSFENNIFIYYGILYYLHINICVFIQEFSPMILFWLHTLWKKTENCSDTLIYYQKKKSNVD